MHSIRPRPICRAYNTFSPSIALWQQFVAPNQQLAETPLKSSFATEAAQSHNDDKERPSHEGSVAGSDTIHNRRIEGFLVRRTNRAPGSDFVPNPELQSSFRRLGRPRIPQGDAWASNKVNKTDGKDVQQLLIAAYDAYDSSQDYEGVVVLPVSTKQVISIPDYRLPWNIRDYKHLTADEKLNLEIRRFHEYIRPSPAEIVARKHVIEQRYLEEYPYLKEIYSVVKATLDIRGLSDVFRGGVGSYSLFMMIVASLKHRPSIRNDATGALLNFLDFWGNFKSSEHGLSIEPPEYLAKTSPIMSGAAMGNMEKGKRAPLPPWMLNLRDPVDETNDLGRKIVAWKHIQATFKSLNKQLRKDLEANSRPSLLARFVRDVYPLQVAHRQRLSNYGLSLSKADRQYTPSNTPVEAAEGVVETAEDANAITEIVDAIKEEQSCPHHSDLDAIAKSIRKFRGPVRKLPLKEWPAADAESVSKAYEDANKQSVAAIEKAKEAAKMDDVQGINTWLKDNEETSEYKQTGDASANITGSNQKADK
ncbi:hypothetical protein E8E12_001812 [Didymella heteroderae]|uniref:Polynucleotide adenylyltransferase n=1 Tax=Didymella heteroderae TaxID=1769908 RepID=A0A9P4WHY0_9PLEO|nr:hypothetical protein E8E12_001812 [Didymella heteroderae]